MIDGALSIGESGGRGFEFPPWHTISAVFTACDDMNNR